MELAANIEVRAAEPTLNEVEREPGSENLAA